MTLKDFTRDALKVSVTWYKCWSPLSYLPLRVGACKSIWDRIRPSAPAVFVLEDW
jgi:hypothetical protein